MIIITKILILYKNIISIQKNKLYHEWLINLTSSELHVNSS
jgi:hypothetical protein